ncbi:MAG: type II toxin-antitoxin system RelE/ParE family toxin [Bacilli bacterium]
MLLEKIMFCLARLRVDGTTKERSGYISPLRDGIYELRPKDHRILFFHWKDGCYILCHVFRKKSQKTPMREIEKAEYAREDWIRRYTL